MPQKQAWLKPTTAHPADVYVYKGVFPRFLATILDGFILGVPAYLLGWVMVYAASNFAQTEQSVLIAVALVLIGILGIIAIAMESAGGTPGKRILGLRIIDASGNKPGLGRALIRNLLRIVDMLPIGYIVGIILVARSEVKQRLGDRLAGTYVVGKE
ncbi:MAG: RDD family protein [Chloroflexi bacterium]|nr:RDD family protein [Chloroflexota bacterium]